MTIEIKFRQENGGSWHYWGYIEGVFISPLINGSNQGGKSYQYTGLKDKNGKEIYEGDIVRFNPDDNIFIGMNGGKIFNTSEVRFADGEFLFLGEYGEEGKEIPFNKTEVIGNIYENPNLIK